MMLKSKIKSKYLNEILDGRKICEFREIEGYELTDENGRTVTFYVTEIDTADEHTRQAIADRYPDVHFRADRPLARIWLGKEIK